MSYWWCNQSNNWGYERPESVVCSSDLTANTTYRKTVGEVSKGDIIVHYKKPNIVAFSRAIENAIHTNQIPPISGMNYGSGWVFKTEYFDLSKPINRDLFAHELIPLIVKHYPIDRRGYARQGYFFPFDRDGIKIILSKGNDKYPVWLKNV